jgi:hypothetical protein
MCWTLVLIIIIIITCDGLGLGFSEHCCKTGKSMLVAINNGLLSFILTVISAGHEQNDKATNCEQSFAIYIRRCGTKR